MHIHICHTKCAIPTIKFIAKFESNIKIKSNNKFAGSCKSQMKPLFFAVPISTKYSKINMKLLKDRAKFSLGCLFLAVTTYAITIYTSLQHKKYFTPKKKISNC